MRCKVCGRPYDGEALLAREVVDQGCHAEYLAFKAEITPESRTVQGEVVTIIPAHLTYTDEQALAMARNLHTAREKAATKAEILRRYEANAAGKHAMTGAPLALAGAELAEAKAHAAEIVAKLKAVE